MTKKREEQLPSLEEEMKNFGKESPPGSKNLLQVPGSGTNSKKNSSNPFELASLESSNKKRGMMKRKSTAKFRLRVQSSKKLEGLGTEESEDDSLSRLSNDKLTEKDDEDEDEDVDELGSLHQTR